MYASSHFEEVRRKGTHTLATSRLISAQRQAGYQKAGPQLACLPACRCIHRGPSNAVERKLAAPRTQLSLPLPLLSLGLPLAIVKHFRPPVRPSVRLPHNGCPRREVRFGEEWACPAHCTRTNGDGRTGGRTGDSVGALTSCGGAQWAHAGKSLPLTIL